MDIIFSKEQTEALRFDLGNTLVSASAGSGKTAVLTERVFRIISSGVKLNELLVLTFTNAAASEMRDRIREKLIKAGLNDLASNVDAVSIQTYDAFALSLVKKYSQKLKLNNSIKVVASEIIDLEIKKTIKSILDSHYLAKDQDVLDLVYEYCLKDDNQLSDFIVSVYNNVDLHFDKEQFLNSFITRYFDEQKLNDYLSAYWKEYRSFLSRKISEVKAFDDIAFAEKVSSYLEEIYNLDSIEKIYAYFSENKLAFPRSSKNLDEEEKVIYSELKNDLTSYIEHLNYPSFEAILTRITSNKRFVKTIIELVKELDKRMTEFKDVHGVYTFQDIFKLAMKIVKNKDINEKMKRQYKYIMIDEYQDTSPLQEELINSFANNNVYAVGDIKQSIYRFRNADCTLFQNKFDAYKKGDGGTLITLYDNYRSRNEVIEDNNRIFSSLMSQENNGLDYLSDHAMKYGNKSYSKFFSGDSYHHEYLRYEVKDIKMLKAEYEARLVANDIITRINNHEQVKDGSSLRDIDFNDFAILSYSKTDFEVYQKVFTEYNIPLYANYEQSLSDNNVTLTFKSIIKCLALLKNNNFDEKFRHSFISLLRSFLFEENDENIEDYFYKNNYDDFEAYHILSNINEKTKEVNLFNVTRLIIDEFNFYEKLIKVGDISNNKELINYFYKLAKMMDALNYSLEDFATFFEELDEYDVDQAFKGSQSSLNSVQLMTIHASKGLQFKFVYYVNLSKTFVLSGSNSSFLYDEEYGIDLPSIHYPSTNGYFHDFIVKKERLANINEQLRVFYVALTRAEEKAILLIPKDGVVKEYSKMCSYLDFLAYSLITMNGYSIDLSKTRSIRTSKNIDKQEVTILEPYKFSPTKHSKIRISKQKSDDASSKALELGNKFHYYLELVDFSSKDTSFIVDEKDRLIIDKFLKNPLFKDADKAKVCHEYAFYDESEDIRGVIDLLLIYDDHIDIVDYKLSKIDDENYARQVEIYKNYLAKCTPSKKINTYIVSILKGEVKEVNYD